MSDTDKDKIIEVLRAEVKAWRNAWHARNDTSPIDAWNARWEKAISEAIAATNAAGALEDK